MYRRPELHGYLGGGGGRQLVSSGGIFLDVEALLGPVVPVSETLQHPVASISDPLLESLGILDRFFDGLFAFLLNGFIQSQAEGCFLLCRKPVARLDCACQEITEAFFRVLAPLAQT